VHSARNKADICLGRTPTNEWAYHTTPQLEKEKGNWSEEIPRIVWSYHTTPQLTTKETPFNLVYGSDVIIPVEIQESSPRFQSFMVKESSEGRKVNLDLLDEVCDHARIQPKALKRMMELRHKAKTKHRQFKVVDLVMWKVHPYQIENKLSPKWIGLFCVVEVLGNNTYKLETLEGGAIPRMWNATNLKFYFN